MTLPEDATSRDAVRGLQERVREAIAAGGRLRPVGGGSKTALAPSPDDPERLAVGHLTGVVEYEPAEYTVTVRAGTPIAELRDLLAAQGQHLPFDPPFAEAGATAGGTVTAGLSGPGRFRYGGVRDFLLGVRFVDGRGDAHLGGGRVVKNAAGFDLPKLMVGSLGRFGVLTELTFKVFPAPEAHATVVFDAGTRTKAAGLLVTLGRSPLDLISLELAPPSRLVVRIGGIAAALDARLERLQEALGGEGELATGAADDAIWGGARSFRWVPEGHALVKAPLTPPRVPALEEVFTRIEGDLDMTLPRRYGAGGSVIWLAWPEAHGPERLASLLAEVGAVGLVVRGDGFGFGAGRIDPRLGARPGGVFEARIASVLDPEGVFDPRGSDPETGDPAAPSANRSDRAA